MKTFQLQQANTDIAVYKKQLKALTTINIRRSSKFNILAIYGALKCMENVTFSERLGVYVITQYAPVSSVAKLLEKQQQGHNTTPFDFLNINGNNAAFYVAKALNATGKNMVVTTKNNTLDDAIALAAFDRELGVIDDALVGWVDESIDGILADGKSSPDISHWVYFSAADELS